MTLGRPPSASLSYIDCEFPEDDATTINDKGEIEMGCECPKSMSSPVLTKCFSFPLEALIHEGYFHASSRTYTLRCATRL